MEQIAIDRLITKEIQGILKLVEAPALQFYLVGGIVRDFLFFNILSSDMDFEVHFDGYEKDFEKIFDDLCVKLQDQYRLEKLPYLVYRITGTTFTLEFSCPRLELIKPSAEGIYSHHYFEAILDPKLEVSESFKRRDFSINAIGIKLNPDFITGEIVDPFFGRISFQKKELQCLGPDFICDPVRYLRAYRFSERYSFTLSRELKDFLLKMKLNELSFFYYLSEWKKSLDLSFGKRILQTMQQNSPHLPIWSSCLSEVLSHNYGGHDIREMLIYGALLCSDVCFSEFRKLNFDRYISIKELNALSVLREKKWFVDYKKRFKNLPMRFGKEASLLTDLKELKRYADAFEILRFELEKTGLVFVSACDWFNGHAQKTLDQNDQKERDQLPPEWRAFFGFSKIKE